MTLHLAKVVAVHPSRRTVDVVMTQTGQRFGNVLVANPHASSDGGSWDVPSVPRPKAEATADMLSSVGRNMLAVVQFAGKRPIVTNFLSPQGGQVAFKEQNRSVHRHVSGAYVTTAPDGSMEFFHPSGAFLRIGTGGHEDMAPLAADGNWVVPAGAPPAQITLSTAGFSLTVLPNGAVTLIASTDVSIKAPASVILDTPTVVTTGNVVVGTGATGTFSTPTGQVVTVADGIVINIH